MNAIRYWRVLLLPTLLCVLAPAAARAQSTTIATEYLMTLHAPLEAPQVIDESLLVYNLRAGSWVKGPKVEGRLAAPTADWLRIRPDGTAHLDVRATIETTDGALIYLSYGGVIRHTPESRARHAAGEILTADEVYFITAPTLRTASEKYAWLNHVQAVGKMVRSKLGEGAFVEYDLFIVR